MITLPLPSDQLWNLITNQNNDTSDQLIEIDSYQSFINLKEKNDCIFDQHIFECFFMQFVQIII